MGPHGYNSEVSSMYRTIETKFAIAEEVSTGVVKNVSVFLGCRDLLTVCVKELYARSGKVPDATMLFFYKEKNSGHTLLNRVSRAVKLLNTIERENKWKRTKAYTIGKVLENNDSEAKGCFTPKTTVYIKGSKMWIKNIYFYYMYVHILRAFIAEKDDKFRHAKTLSDFIDIAVVERNSDGRPTRGLIAHVNGIDHWPLVFQHRRKLFKGQTIKNLYRPEDDTIDGIHCLTTGSGRVEKVNQRFAKLLVKERSKNV
jgi:hypothetical protein